MAFSNLQRGTVVKPDNFLLSADGQDAEANEQGGQCAHGNRFVGWISLEYARSVKSC